MYRTEGRNKLGKGFFHQIWGSDLIGKGVAAAHWLAEKLIGCPSPELVHNHRMGWCMELMTKAS